METFKPRFKEGDVIWTLWKNKAIPLTVKLAFPIKDMFTYYIKEHNDDNLPVPQWVSEQDAFASKQEIIDQL